MNVFKGTTLAICGAAVLWVLAGTIGNASTYTKMTYFKFNAAVALPGVTLEAGDYVFELANPDTSRNVVRVTNRQRSRLHLTAITRPVPRPGGLRDGLVTFGEAASGSPRPITAWFPQGESVGYQFIY